MNEPSYFIALRKWYQVALFNLVILSALGLALRYKINFELSWLQQKNLLHAHSHFAFSGWISFLLQLLLLNFFTNGYNKSSKFWNRFFAVSTVVNYAMIVSFAWVGYAGISIVFSTASLWLSYVFAYKIYKLLVAEKENKVSNRFIKASLFFLVLSSLGTYALAIIMASESQHQYWYHNALYFFLHFQYNGWFTFAVLAFLMKKLESSRSYNIKHANAFFLLLAVTCIPAYFFTSLWHHRPMVITVIIIATAILQTAALFYLYKLLIKNMKNVYITQPAICRWLYSLAISAFILKVLLQFCSAFPQLQQLAFGFRPVIIGYLHLIFLVFVSLYLLSIIADKKIISLNHSISFWGLIIFTGGVIINELFLAVQGFAAISSLYLPALNVWLFCNTFIMLIGALLLFIASKKRDDLQFYSSKPIFQF